MTLVEEENVCTREAEHHHLNQHPKHNLLRSISFLDMPPTYHRANNIWFEFFYSMRTKIFLLFLWRGEIVCIVNNKKKSISYRTWDIMAVWDVVIIWTRANAWILVSMIDASISILAWIVCTKINLVGN